MSVFYPEATSLREILNFDVSYAQQFSLNKIKRLTNRLKKPKRLKTLNSKDGFRLPTSPGMYGAGIYFATNSSKSAQDIYTKKSNKLLVCKVLLGREKIVHKADSSITKENLRKAGFDSVFAPRDTKGSGGVLNDEFIIFDPNQVLPEYIIHFGNANDQAINALLRKNDLQVGTGAQPFSKKTVTPSKRSINSTDPFELECLVVEAFFDKVMKMHPSPISKKVSKVDFIFNKTLQNKFDAKEAEFSRKGITTNIIRAFHGTNSANVDSILKTNLNRKVGQAYGSGYYFSEFPQVSQGYGDALILFKVMPGNEYTGNDSNKHVDNDRYQCRKVVGSVVRNNDGKMGYGDILVINDNAQFLPYCVLHLS